MEELNFTIYEGEYLSLLGPSGCGKTTTLRLLSGLILPTTGQIHWDGKSVEKIPASKRDIGYVFQQFAIFPHLSVWENIAFGPQVKGYHPTDVEETVEEYLTIMGLSDKVDAMPKQLNAPDLQRVGIARVLATGAKTLLLDEPMGALDTKIREKFQDELVRLVKKLSLTAIHVTHDQSEAMAISDRIGVMKKGKMIQLGSPNDLLYHPTQIFSAYFIGEADFLEGIISKLNSKTTEISLLGDEKIVTPTKTRTGPNFTVGQKVIVGVRREFFRMTHSETTKQRTNVLSGTIISDRFLGEKRRTLVQLEYGRKIEVKRQPDEIALSNGAKVLVTIPENAVFLFNYPLYGLDDAINVT